MVYFESEDKGYVLFSSFAALAEQNDSGGSTSGPKLTSEWAGELQSDGENTMLSDQD